ncbi:hypothetical protein AZF37_07795 [endosymbiont 'TC1' of Trimyema compressum]|nr:hypothetical protein AZF37_07795 [endosymbiont 'TC1' of Trimyema compressum]
MKHLSAIAPVFVPGNHEFYSGLYAELKKKLIEMGVVVFMNNHLLLEENNEKIALLGIEDPVFKGNVREKEYRHHSIKLLLHIKDDQFTEKASLKPELDKAIKGVDHHLFTILLSTGQNRCHYIRIILLI